MNAATDEVLTCADTSVRAYSVAELAALWSCGKTFIYDEIRAGRLRTIAFGRGDRGKVRVAATAAAHWLDRHST